MSLRPQSRWWRAWAAGSGSPAVLAGACLAAAVVVVLTIGVLEEQDAKGGGGGAAAPGTSSRFLKHILIHCFIEQFKMYQVIFFSVRVVNRAFDWWNKLKLEERRQLEKDKGIMQFLVSGSRIFFLCMFR